MFQKSAVLLLTSALVLSLSACIPGFPGSSSSPSDNPSASPSSGLSLDANLGVSLPDPASIATFTGLKAVSCSEEANLKSTQGAATTVKFQNKSDARIKLYWLDFNGKRVEYAKPGINAGASHSQGTFVTHPWLIANEQDQCMGIYVPTDTGTVTLDINQSVTVSSGTTASSGDANEDRVRRGIECLKAKGDTSNATAIQGILNLYIQQKKILGAEIAYQGYLSAGVEQLNKLGC